MTKCDSDMKRYKGIFLYEQIASLQAQIKKSRDNLSYFYSKNVIDKIYYNDMIAIASFYQYFKTKQTYSLGFDRSTGDTGAYRIYEYEKANEYYYNKT